MLLFCSCVAAAVVLPLFCSALRCTMNASCTVPVHVLRDAEGRDHWVVARESYDSALMEIACKGIAERIDPSSKAQDIVVAEASLGSRRDHLPQGLHPVLEQMQAHILGCIMWIGSPSRHAHTSAPWPLATTRDAENLLRNLRFFVKSNLQLSLLMLTLRRKRFTSGNLNPPRCRTLCSQWGVVIQDLNITMGHRHPASFMRH